MTTPPRSMHVRDDDGTAVRVLITPGAVNISVAHDDDAAWAELTPRQAADLAAAIALDRALEIVADYIHESIEVGGVKAADLLWRLTSAGYKLPDAAPTQEDTHHG